MGGCDTRLPEHVSEVGIYLYCFGFALVAGVQKLLFYFPKEASDCFVFRYSFPLSACFGKQSLNIAHRQMLIKSAQVNKSKSAQVTVFSAFILGNISSGICGISLDLENCQGEKHLPPRQMELNAPQAAQTTLNFPKGKREDNGEQGAVTSDKEVKIT